MSAHRRPASPLRQGTDDMSTSPNKNYIVPTTGAETDVWGETLRNSCFAITDRNLGGIVTKTLSNVPVVLSATESENLIVRLIGTLTGAVLVTTACKGMTIVENLTSGAFAVTFGNGVGSPVTIPQSTRAVVITDGTNGVRTAADNQTEFASGTALLFPQAVAPTGWTKQNTGGTAGAAIRVNQTAGGTTGGTFSFDSVFTVRGFSGSVSSLRTPAKLMALTSKAAAAARHGTTSRLRPRASP